MNRISSTTSGAEARISPISRIEEGGIGAALVNEGLRLAREMGYTAVFLVGDPAYYGRFGFRPSVAFGIKHAYDAPDENVMACELVQGALEGIRGTVTCI